MTRIYIIVEVLDAELLKILLTRLRKDAQDEWIFVFPVSKKQNTHMDPFAAYFMLRRRALCEQNSIDKVRRFAAEVDVHIEDREKITKVITFDKQRFLRDIYKELSPRMIVQFISDSPCVRRLETINAVCEA